MRMLTPDGLVVVEVQTDEEASELGSYWSAIHHFLATNDDSRIEPFGRKSLGGHRYETNLDAILDWYLAGEISFDEIYEM
jgi:hypothetical protein